MYPSDYGYAVDLNERVCDTYIWYYEESGKEVCKSNNWLFSGKYIHLITLYQYRNESTFSISPMGNVPRNECYDNYYVRPTLVLNPDLIVDQATDGSKNNPYKLLN